MTEHIEQQIEARKIAVGRKNLVISIDIDGFLGTGEAWDCDECAKLVPNLEIIEMVNRLALIHFIVIHTARRRELATATIEWLEKHNVRYHAIKFEKMPADIYLDDKAIQL